MTCEQSMVHEQPMILEGVTVHEPWSVCTSAHLKVVAILYAVAC
jgi:hypothetical protein